MTTPENHLHNEIDKLIEQLRTKLHDKVDTWAKIEQPEEMLNLEQELQSITGTFQGQMVGGVLEAIHLNLDFVISCQTQALIGGLRNVDWRSVSIQTLGGLEITISSPYTARKKAKKRGRKRKKRGRGGSGDYPVLRRLGIVGRATPALLAEVNRQVADGPSEKEVQERLAARGIRLDTKTIRRYVRDFAGIALWQRSVDIHEIQPLESTPLAGKRVVLAIDGGRLRTRVNKRGRRRKSGRHGFKNEWCEPKLFVIYTINDKGRKERLGELVYDGTLQSADGCFKLIALQLKHLGINQAQSLTVLGDGASWIWKRVPELTTLLELQISVVQILDFRHAVEKIVKAAKASSLNALQIKFWVRRIKKWLKKGHVDKVLEALSDLDDSNDTEEDIRLAIGYCQKHYHRMQYADFIAQNLPIGSGVIESAIRRIVNLRIKGPGIFWLPENAERVVHLRSQVKAGGWSNFVKSVLTKWSSDFQVSLAQVRAYI